MTFDEVFTPDASDALVEVLTEMTDSSSERQKVLDTLRIMLDDQRAVLFAMKERELIHQEACGVFAPLFPPNKSIGFACATADFLSSVFTRACQQLDMSPQIH